MTKELYSQSMIADYINQGNDKEEVMDTVIHNKIALCLTKMQKDTEQISTIPDVEWGPHKRRGEFRRNRKKRFKKLEKEYLKFEKSFGSVLNQLEVFGKFLHETADLYTGVFATVEDANLKEERSKSEEEDDSDFEIEEYNDVEEDDVNANIDDELKKLFMSIWMSPIEVSQKEKEKAEKCYSDCPHMRKEKDSQELLFEKQKTLKKGGITITREYELTPNCGDVCAENQVFCSWSVPSMIVTLGEDCVHWKARMQTRDSAMIAEDLKFRAWENLERTKKDFSQQIKMISYNNPFRTLIKQWQRAAELEDPVVPNTTNATHYPALMDLLICLKRRGILRSEAWSRVWKINNCFDEPRPLDVISVAEKKAEKVWNNLWDYVNQSEQTEKK